MPSLIELTTQLVTAQTTSAAMSTEEIVASLTKIHSTLGQLEGSGTAVDPGRAAVEPKISVERSFRKNEIICLICGKAFKTLGHHLISSHGIKPKEYRQKFNIHKTQALASKLHAESTKERVQNLRPGAKVKTAASGEGIALSDVRKSPTPPVQKKKVGRPPKTAKAVPAV